DPMLAAQADESRIRGPRNAELHAIPAEAPAARLCCRCRNPWMSKTLKSAPIDHSSEFSVRALFSLAVLIRNREYLYEAAKTAQILRRNPKTMRMKAAPRAAALRRGIRIRLVMRARNLSIYAPLALLLASASAAHADVILDTTGFENTP